MPETLNSETGNTTATRRFLPPKRPECGVALLSSHLSDVRPEFERFFYRMGNKTVKFQMSGDQVVSTEEIR